MFYLPGSSPHTRGARASHDAAMASSWIIPAYAGSTNTDPAPTPAAGDHPRIRGEHGSGRRCRPGGVGSSPHTRGAPKRPGRLTRPGGIIPAYAGSTPARVSRRSGSPDHPRIRGEHAPARSRAAGMVGSSPHTRGARLDSLRVEDAVRIIPAYAGSTGEFGGGVHGCEDHPRIRGEHERVSDVRGARAGSSPHTRGAPGRFPRS